MNDNEIKSMLVGFICDNFELEEGDIDDDTPLFSSSLLDSFSMLVLVTQIEEELNIRFKALDLHLGNLDSVDKIVVFIKRTTT